jgi:hypothetical protein
MISKRRVKEMVQECLSLKEFSVFYKNQLICEQFEGESDDEDDEGSYDLCNVKERNFKEQKDCVKKRKQPSFKDILEHVDLIKRKKQNENNEKQKENEAKQNENDKKQNEKSPQEKKEIKQDISKDKIQELIITGDNLKVSCVSFVIFSSTKSKIVLSLANENPMKYNFMVNELSINHLNNYVLKVNKIDFDKNKICSLDSDSKSSKKKSSLKKRSNYDQNIEPGKPVEIMNDENIQVLKSKRIKES